VIVVERKLSNFSANRGENKLFFSEMMMRSTKLDFYNASSLKQQSADRHVAPLGHIIQYSDSKPTSLCWKSNKYQFCSLWFAPIRARTHDLPLEASMLTPKGNYPQLLKMMRICIFPLHCCTLYFRKDCLHVHF
jgi:hypothetical protein